MGVIQSSINQGLQSVAQLGSLKNIAKGQQETKSAVEKSTKDISQKVEETTKTISGLTKQNLDLILAQTMRNIALESVEAHKQNAKVQFDTINRLRAKLGKKPESIVKFEKKLEDIDKSVLKTPSSTMIKKKGAK